MWVFPYFLFFRFFFTFRGRWQSNPFSDVHVQVLRNRHLGDLLCDNAGLDWTRRNAFALGSARVRCGSHNRLVLHVNEGKSGGGRGGDGDGADVGIKRKGRRAARRRKKGGRAKKKKKI